MRRLKNIFTEREIKFAVILMPLNKIMVEGIEKLGLLPQYKMWRQEMKEIFGKVYDYSEGEFQKLEYYYPDGTHLIPPVTRKMIKRIIDDIVSNRNKELAEEKDPVNRNSPKLDSCRIQYEM